MNNSDFRKLTEDEVKKFCAHARANYKPGDEIPSIYHPAWQAEAALMNLEVVQGKDYSYAPV